MDGAGERDRGGRRHRARQDLHQDAQVHHPAHGGGVFDVADRAADSGVRNGGGADRKLHGCADHVHLPRRYAYRVL